MGHNTYKSMGRVGLIMCGETCCRIEEPPGECSGVRTTYR